MIYPLNRKNHDAIPPTTQNGQSNKITNSFIHDIPPTYECQIARATEIKFIYDRYAIPVIIEFDTSDSNNSVIITVKHLKLFAALKILDPSFSIITNDTTINYPRKFPIGIEYTETF